MIDMKKYFSMASLFTALFVLNPTFASGFEEMFDSSANGFSRQASRVVGFMSSNSEFDVLQQKKEFDFISVSLIGIEEQFINNPVYWFVRGLHSKNMASYYQSTEKPALIKESLREKNKHYLMAMSLDKNHEPHLSASVYAEMKSGLPEKYKQEAIQAELGLGGSGESDSYYWYLHWSNVNELQKQGRLEEAGAALLKMKKELNESDQENVYKALYEKIKNELKPKELKSVEKTIKSAEPEHAAFTEETAGESYYRYLIIIASIMLGLIIVALVFELWRRKRKEG